MSLKDFRSVLQVLAKIEPDEVYNLAGQTSVGLSFEQPVETLESIATGILNLVEAIRFTGGKLNYIRPVLVSVLATPEAKQQRNAPHFIPEIPMQLPKQQRFGK